MARFIDFTTKSKYAAVTYETPVHNGVVPPGYVSIKGVRVDGTPVAFKDDGLTERLHRTLVEGRALERKKRTVDCFAFVALMNGLQPQLSHGRGTAKIKTLTEADQLVRVDDATVAVPVELGTLSNDGIYLAKHIVEPAHTADSPQYVHKLGREAVCLSGLGFAVDFYHCQVARSVVSLFVASEQSF